MEEVVYDVVPVLLSLLLRLGISYGPHSGQSKPPIYGDYEAQRHWQEITHNLPMSEWYVNTTDNNLLYWGLDYPPLTAYHSKALGGLASMINSSWVSLKESRGEESYKHKIFMRCSVLLGDVIYLIPLYLLTRKLTHNASKIQQVAVLLLVMLAPGQPLIDHGHFQYNNISLGLTLLAVWSLSRDLTYIGACLFALALNYKQMCLYHALPFFCYLLGPRYNSLRGFAEVIKIGVVVIGTFAVCWLPLYQTIPDVIIRLFPFNRGLFEDKVANFWCTLTLVFKIQNHVETVTLVRLTLFTTVLAVLPSQFHLFRYPTLDRFILALTNSALGFFLFSFHVHEKTILIPGLTTLLLFTETPLVAIWFQVISTFSMWPLLLKDGQVVMYVVSLSLYICISYVILKNKLLTPNSKYGNHVDWSLRYLYVVSLMGCGVLHVLEAAVPPPARYPYLYPTLNAAYSALHFGAFFCYFHCLQYQGLPNMFVARKRVKTE